MTKYTFISIFIFIFISCSNDKNEIIDNIQSEEIKLYSSFFKNINPDTLASFRNINNSKLIVKNFTLGYSDSILLMNAIKEMNISDSSIVYDFLKKNNRVYSLNIIQETFSHSLILSSDVQTKIYNDKKINWESFYNLFPNAIGLATSSRIGFNSSHSLALLRIDLEFGKTSGEKLYFFYMNKNNKWIVIHKFVINWVN
ncbi:MAG: hypothetical protein IPH97_17615 [Ignavibacteriales bacterium]|nr:hypothetical protein [Ignavibacteriales bacterium]